MIAEAERVHGEESEQPSRRGHRGPSQDQPQCQREQRDVQRVDLGDHRLAPEGVRGREEQRGRDRRGQRAGQFRGDHDDQPARDRRLDCRRQVQRMRRVAAGDPQHRVGDREIQRVAVSRRDQRRPRHRLKRSGVAEIKPGQQRRAIQGERRQADEQRGKPSEPDHRPAISEPRASRRSPRGRRRAIAC